MISIFVIVVFKHKGLHSKNHSKGVYVLAHLQQYRSR